MRKHSEKEVASLLEALGFLKIMAGEEDFSAAVSAVTTLLNHEPEEGRPKLGLLISGKTGVGKTLLAEIVIKVLKYRGENVVRVNLGDETHLNYFRGDFQDFYNLDLAAMTVFLDDVGAEKQVYEGYVLTEKVIQFIWTFHSRADPKGRLIATTNLNSEQVDARYGARTYSRFKDLFLVLALKGPDKRHWIKAA